MNLIRTLAIAAALPMLTGSLDAGQRTCRIVYPERPENAPLSAFLFDGKSSRQVSLPSMNLSEVIELPPGELVIAFTPEEIVDPKQLPENALLLNISKELTDFYIIVSPDPKNSGFPVRMNLVEVGKGQLQPGETLWYNFTPHGIAAKLGDAELTIAPMAKAISKSPMPASGYYKAIFAYQDNGKGPYAPITKQMWWHDANSRHLGFLTNSGGRLPKIFFFCDFRISEDVIREVENAEARSADAPETPAAQ